MPGIYRPRHPERTVLYRVLFHNFDRFLIAYERRFEKEYGYFRPIDRINFHPHLHLLLTEGGVDRAGIFHRLPRLDDARLAEIFGREVLALLVSKGLLSHEWAERILSWRHTGFNVSSRIFIARVTSHIPDKGQVMVRYYGLYTNAQIHPSSDVDVRSREASARPSLRASGPAGGRGERGVRITTDLESEGGSVIVWPLSRPSGPAIRWRKLPPVGIWIIATYPRPGYPYFVRGRVDSEADAGGFTPREKRNFLSIRKVSWQRIYSFIKENKKLSWLTDAIADKYGIV